jgi:hypothetical protein
MSERNVLLLRRARSKVDAHDGDVGRPIKDRHALFGRKGAIARKDKRRGDINGVAINSEIKAKLKTRRR